MTKPAADDLAVAKANADALMGPIFKALGVKDGPELARKPLQCKHGNAVGLCRTCAKVCRECGDSCDQSGLCNRCYREVKGAFEFERSDE